jgi:Mg2+/Co2+ transporter CorB
MPRQLRGLKDHANRRPLLVSEHGALIGIIALDDLLKIIEEELTLLGRVFAREHLQERQSRP